VSVNGTTIAAEGGPNGAVTFAEPVKVKEGQCLNLGE